MRCFTWEDGTIVDGITVQNIAEDTVLYLGKEKRYWSRLCVEMHPYNPPETYKSEDDPADSYILDAYPVSQRETRTAPGSRFVLAKPDPKHEGDTRVLALIVTECDGIHPEDAGFWRTLSGDVETIAAGVVSAEGGGFWKRGLVRFREGDTLHVSLANPFLEDYVLKLEDGELTTYLWSEYFEES